MQEYITIKKKELGKSLQNFSNVLLLGDLEKKQDIVKETLAEIKLYNKMDEKYYCFPLSIVMENPTLHLTFILKDLFHEYNKLFKSRKR